MVVVGISISIHSGNSASREPFHLVIGEIRVCVYCGQCVSSSVLQMMAADSLLQTSPRICGVTATDILVDKTVVSLTLSWDVVDSSTSLDHFNIYSDHHFLGRSYSTHFRVVNVHHYNNSIKLQIQPVMDNGFKYIGNSMTSLTLNIVWQYNVSHQNLQTKQKHDQHSRDPKAIAHIY